MNYPEYIAKQKMASRSLERELYPDGTPDADKNFEFLEGVIGAQRYGLKEGDFFDSLARMHAAAELYANKQKNDDPLHTFGLMADPGDYRLNDRMYDGLMRLHEQLASALDAKVADMKSKLVLTPDEEKKILLLANTFFTLIALNDSRRHNYDAAASQGITGLSRPTDEERAELEGRLGLLYKNYSEVFKIHQS